MEQLINKAIMGEAKAEEELFQTLFVRFRAIARHRVGEEEAEDIAQEACLTVLKKYRTETYTVSFKFWAYGILRNKIGNYLQGEKLRQKTQVPEAEAERTVVLSSPAPDHDLRRRLHDCMKKLIKVHPRYARVLNLVHQGYKTDEVCKRLDITTNNFYVILNRGRTLLKRCLETGVI